MGQAYVALQVGDYVGVHNVLVKVLVVHDMMFTWY